MKRKNKIIIIACLSLVFLGTLFAFTYVPELSNRYGKVSTKLYLGKTQQQPLIVAFGGGGGGNDWTRHYLKPKRDSLLEKGYALLAIGYFKTVGTPDNLDRISLNAIRDTIIKIAMNPKIDGSKIILLGGSRGAELALNLASKFDDFKGVIALSTSNVSFPAITWTANTSSWMYNDQEVAYVPAPFKTIGPALKGDLYTAHLMMLEDREAAKKAEIQVERINGPILILSGINDNQWPATQMSDSIVRRLDQHNFEHYYAHTKLQGGHIAPLEHFNLVYAFLSQHFKIN